MGCSPHKRHPSPQMAPRVLFVWGIHIYCQVPCVHQCPPAHTNSHMAEESPRALEPWRSAVRASVSLQYHTVYICSFRRHALPEPNARKNGYREVMAE